MSKIAIVGLQWGDEGKGKFVDYFASGAKVIVRFQGGNNAGHTIVINNKSYKLSVLPSGILHKNKISFIGSGVVLDLAALEKEINEIKLSGIDISPDNLKIAENITIIIPLYKKLDLLLEGIKQHKIGTTGRGIGFAYQDQVGRRGIRVCDIYDKATLDERVEDILNFYSPFLEKHDKNFSVTETKNEILEYCNYYKDIFKDYLVHPTFLSSFTGENILFEGAQGAMLDVSFGTYPFVTSSNTLASQSFIGSGCSGKLDKVFGVVKAYSTRVGFGPFPTEDFNEDGKLMQERGAEFGTVTGRKRRCGYLDLVALKYICNLSGVTDIILTKIDVLNTFKKIKVCTSYKIKNKTLNTFPTAKADQESITPIYEELEGWGDDYSFNTQEELPINLKNYIKFIENFLNIKVSVLSFGAEREDTLNLTSIW